MFRRRPSCMRASRAATRSAARVPVRLVALLILAGMAASCRGSEPVDRGGVVLATGQTKKLVAGDDGDLRRGVPSRFVDNGNGTVSDLTTGLMWTKKCREDPPGDLCPEDHHVHTRYLWFGHCSATAESHCSIDADCPEGESCDHGESIWGWLQRVNAEAGRGFAGYSDWRLPNLRELHTLIDYGRMAPAVGPAFNRDCASPCSVMTCSCSAGPSYWSTTSSANSPDSAWNITFAAGIVMVSHKTGEAHVRAVRGGSAAPEHTP
jgi:hypothetical protein